MINQNIKGYCYYTRYSSSSQFIYNYYEHKIWDIKESIHYPIIRQYKHYQYGINRVPYQIRVDII